MDCNRIDKLESNSSIPLRFVNACSACRNELRLWNGSSVTTRFLSLATLVSGRDRIVLFL
jgi:hypothetical protein